MRHRRRAGFFGLTQLVDDLFRFETLSAHDLSSRIQTGILIHNLDQFEGKDQCRSSRNIHWVVTTSTGSRSENKATRHRTHPMAGQSLSAAISSNVCCLQQPTYVITHRTTSFVKRACSAYGLSFSVRPKNPPGAVARGHIARPLVDFTGRSAGARTDIRRTRFRVVYRSVLPASTLYGVGYPGVKSKFLLPTSPILCGRAKGFVAIEPASQ